MNDFLAAFERRFLSEAPRHENGQVEAYCRWLLGNRKSTEPTLQDPEDMVKAYAWYARCEELFREAENLAASGEQRGGLAFDSLKKRSLELADECLSGSHRGDVFSWVLKAFDAPAKASKVKHAVASSGKHNARGGAPTTFEVWQEYPQMGHVKLSLLRKIEKCASRGSMSLDDLRYAENAFATRYPNNRKLVEMATANGMLLRKLMDWTCRNCVSKGAESELSRVLERSLFPSHLQKVIRSNFDRCRTAAQRAFEARQLKKRMAKQCVSSSEVSHADKKPVAPNLMPAKKALPKLTFGGNANSILNLKPARRWTIVSDETGALFDNSAFDGTPQSGRYVFVLIPDYANLPPLKMGWHAVDQSVLEIAKAAEDLSRSGCGILGIPVRGLYPTNRLLWYACIESLLDVTLRLLPVDGNTEILLNVEQRGSADSSNSILLDKTLDDAMYRLSLSNPQKAAQIKLSAKFIKKTDSRLSGYADLAAYSWGCSKSIRPMFNKYGWRGSCLVSDDAQTVQAFRRCLDLVCHDTTLPEEDWNALVQSRDVTAVGSLIGALLRAFGEEAQKDSKKWNLYLDYVLQHLDSKAIRMSTLVPQIGWLKEYEPAVAQLPPRLRLLWLTAQLAASNHQGGTMFGAKQYAQEFKALSEHLKDEDAPLVCFAALHLAVEKTDSYEFKAARGMLQPWENEPIAVPGLRYHAQVLSSLGQHVAFLGDNNRALDYFKRAMDKFSRLSSDWQRDFDQTCAYAVIAAMDANSPDLERLMAMYLYGGEWDEETMIDMAHQFAAVGEDEPDSKYAHAILLRYLVTLPADNPIRSAYLADSAKWKWSEDGHPWGLIAFYRSWLLPADNPAHSDWLKRGYELCLGGGPTLQAIAAVIGAARLGYDGFGKEEYLQKVGEVENLLPNIGADRIAALRAQVDNSLPPLELAAKVLPFNFR